MRRRESFILVELLIVIATIVIVTTILFPVFQKVTFALGASVPVSYGYNLNAVSAAGSQFLAPANTALLFEVTGDISNLTRGGDYPYGTGPLGSRQNMSDTPCTPAPSQPVASTGKAAFSLY